MHATSTPSSPQTSLLDHRYGHGTLWAATGLTLLLALILALIPTAHLVGVVAGGATVATGLAYRHAITVLSHRPSARRVDVVDLWVLIHYQVVTIACLSLLGATLLELLRLAGG